MVLVVACSLLHLKKLNETLMKHILLPLPYDYAALEPHIDEETMKVHHDKHHASYVAKLNEALEKLPQFQDRTADWLLCNLDKIPDSLRVSVRNNAGGHINHSMYWKAMSPNGGGAPKGLLAEAIIRDFGSFDEFKAEFVKAGEKVFGSGWVWLARAQHNGGKLSVITTQGHDNPILHGLLPVLVSDVWEHAYYLKYQNRRPEFLNGWWAIVNWQEAASRFKRTKAEQDWADEGIKALPAKQ